MGAMDPNETGPAADDARAAGPGSIDPAVRDPGPGGPRAEPEPAPQVDFVPMPDADVGRRRGTRLLAFALAAVLLVVVALGGGLTRPRTLQHVVDGPPPVVRPTGQLERAFELAREASVRIEARCGGALRGQVLGLGTGFFIRDDGQVLTAYHVVDTSSTGLNCPVSYVAVTPERLEYPLLLVGFDAYLDLAVLQADVGRSVPVIPLAAAAPSPGTPVVAIGNSRDEFLQARAGEVTRLGVHAGRADFADGTIELTNALAPGDSGGPVVNDRGEAVGVVSYISFNPGAMTSDGYLPPFLRGVPLPRDFAAYAVPVVGNRALLGRLASGEQHDVPVVGFQWRQGLDYDPANSDVYLGPRPGPIVFSVQPGGPADRAGLRSMQERTVQARDGSTTRVPQADVIVAVDGVATPTFYDLLAVIRGKAIGETVTITVQRGGATFRLPLELEAKRAVFAGG